MSRLELKVAPDVDWLLVAGLMWLVSAVTPRLDIAAPIALLGDEYRDYVARVRRWL